MCLKIIFHAMQTRLILLRTHKRMQKGILRKAIRQLGTFRKCVLTPQVTSHWYQLWKSHRTHLYIRGLVNSEKSSGPKRLLSLHIFGSRTSLKLFPSNSSCLILMRHLSSYSYTDALLEDISVRISNNDLTLDCLFLLINRLHSSLYDHFSFHLPCEDPLNRKRQILYSVYHKDFKILYNSNPNFKEIIHFVEVNIDKISIHHCPILLSVLSLLLDERHPLLQNLHAVCKDNLEQLQLHEIAIFLGSDTFCIQHDFETTGEILKLVKDRISDGFISDPDLLMMFCEISRHTGYLMSKDTFVKALLFVINSICDNLLVHHPVESLNAFCRFPLGLFGDLDEDVREKVLELELKFDRVKFNVTDLDIDTCLNLGTVLDPVLNHSFLKTLRWESFKNFVKEVDTKDADPLELLKLCFLFYTTDITPNFMPKFYRKGCQEQETHLLHQLSRLIDLCDNFWLVQMLKLESLRKLPFEIRKKIHKRLEELPEVFSELHLNWLLDEKEDEITLLLFNNLLQKPSSKPMNIVAQKTCSTLANPVCCKTMAVVVLQKMTDELMKNHVLSHQEMEFGLKLVNRMDFQRILYLLTVLNFALLKGSLFHNNKKQIHQFTDVLKEAIQDKISSVSFHPPVTLLPKQPFFYISASTLLSSCSITQLIESLSSSTSTLDKHVCLRAITLLHDVSCRKPCYVPETLENLLQFVYNNKDIPLRSFLSLLKTISLAGYLPEDAERFKILCLQVQMDAIRKNLLTPLEKLQLMFHMSLMEMYENINHYLSVDTLLNLDKEINNLRIFNPASAAYFHDCLFLLIQNVVVECPHLSVQPFVKSLVVSKEPKPALNRLLQSVKRIFTDSSFIASSTCSPYGHTIDILISLNWDGFAFELKHPDCLLYNSNRDISSYRLALLYLNENHFCKINCKRLTGIKMASIRQLQLLGYSVIDVPYYRLQMMDLQHDDALDDFIRSRIHSELGINEMFE